MTRRAILIDVVGRSYVGELLYVHFYPRTVYDENDKVVGFERHPQRVGLRLNDGCVWHFTVPRSLRETRT